MSENGKKKHGGPRPNSGRPRKLNPEDYMQITCVLRRDTVEKLRAGAGGKHKFFGSFLQFHLDRFPLPTHQEYLAMKQRTPVLVSSRKGKVPVIFGGRVGSARRAAGAVVRKRASEAELLKRKFMKEFEPA